MSWFENLGNRKEIESPFPELSKSWFENIGKLELSPLHGLAFAKLSKDWYQKRGKLSNKNLNRRRTHQISDETNVRNIKKLLENEASQQSSSQKFELQSLKESVSYFEKNGPLVLAKEMIESYRKYKNDALGTSYTLKMAPSTFVDRLTKYGSFKLVKVFSKTYVILTSSLNMDRIESLLNDIPEHERSSIVNNQIKEKIGGIFKRVLSYHPILSKVIGFLLSTTNYIWIYFIL